MGNGAIFEGTKGSIFADFTSRLIIPNNDDGDLTYYKRRSREETLPLIGGTGQVTQAAARPAPPRRSRRPRPTTWPEAPRCLPDSAPIRSPTPGPAASR